MRSIFDVEPEEEPGAFTPEQMRGQLRRIAERQPEDVYGAGLPKGHVAAVLAGKAEPLPALLAMLELRAVDGGYASTVPEEPEPPYIPAWPDGSPFTRADEATVVDCVREAFGAGADGDSKLDRHYDLSQVLVHGMIACA